MLVNHKRQLLFIHIPKNAGTTFKNILYSTHGDVEWQKPFGTKKKYTHQPLKSFVASFPECKDYKVITIIRNPYERALSWYTYYRTPSYYNKHPQMRSIHYAQQSFLEFLKWYDRNFKSKWEMLPQTWWYSHKKKLHSDYQIRFENFNNDINKLCDELNMDLSFDIPHNNKSKESLEVKDVYSDESISIINRWYEKDFEELQYSMLEK
ncbi:MAG: sulfotransferase family 2 domain-containing protein [Pelagibacteraceae bacterium]|nr:sulfotransferase family 2 domain-containing protein [Pelagibacteraceae bacterium]